MSSIPVMQKANSKSESPSHHFHLLTSGETRSINAALEAEDRAFMERKAAKVAARLSVCNLLVSTRESSTYNILK